jgi:flagellar basal-body rod protein FlgC
MAGDFDDTLKVSAAAMTAQSVRLRTIAENLANANTSALTPGGDPYRRKVVTFRNELDRASGDRLVRVDKIVHDTTPFETHYAPGSPGADANGYIKTPNVNPLIELGDLREAQQSYQANVDVISVAKSMLSRAVDLLKP